MKLIQNVVFNYLLKEKGYFYILDEIKFNHFLGSQINQELYLDIIGLTGNVKDSRLSNFKSTHNIQYFGELLERYEERGIVKSDEDFRALVLATFVNMKNSKLTDTQINTTQLTDFIKKAEEFAKSKQDVFCLILLTLIADLTLVDYVKMCESGTVEMNDIYNSSIKNLETNEELSFEERTFLIYSLNNYLSEEIKFLETLDESIRDKYDKDIDKLVQKREKLLSFIKETRFKPLEFKRDFYIYLMLIDMIESNESLTKSKEFKNKEILTQFKKLLALVKKEYKKDSADDLVNLFNMDADDILFYNYVCAKGYGKFLGHTTKISSKGMYRLAQSLISFLERDEKCDEFILENIEMELKKIAESNLPGQSSKWYKHKKGMNLSLVEFFGSFDGKISLSNIEFIHNNIDLECLNEHNNLYANRNFEYMINDGYVDYLYKLARYDLKNVLESHMSCSTSFECSKKSYELWTNLRDRGHDSLGYANMFEALFEKGVLDENSLVRFENEAKYNGFLRLLTKREDFKKLYEEANLYVKDIDDMEIKISGYVGKNIDVYKKYLKDLAEIILKTNILDHYKEEDDLEFIRDFYTLQDSLKLICFTKVDYVSHIYKRLTNKDYVRIMDISDEEVVELLKELRSYIEDEKYKINKYNVDRIRKNIDDLVLSDFEKEERRKAQLEEAEKLSLEKLEDTKYYYDFVSCIKKNECSESFVEKVKLAYLEKIKSDKEKIERYNKCFSSAEDMFVVARTLQKNGATLSDEELLEISKACLELV